MYICKKTLNFKMKSSEIPLALADGMNDGE